jgi:hypothetical protein
MSDLKAAAQQALEFVEFLWREVLLNDWAEAKREETELSLRAALEQPEQAEPVAWMVYTLDGNSVCVTDDPADFTDGHRALPLYTHPPRRAWRGLTEEEVNDCIKYPGRSLFARDGTTSQRIARAVEAALKEKNHG